MRLRIGRVGRPHGNDGTFHVADPTTRHWLLEAGRQVSIGERVVTIARRGGTDARPLLGIEGIESRAEIEAMTGLAITVSREQVGRLPEGEHFVDELISCEVRGGDRSIGRVRDVVPLPSVDALEVERPGGDTVLVPLVEDAVTSIDIERRRIDVDLDFLQLRDDTF